MDKRKRYEDGSDDHPLYSRLFVVCDRKTTEEQLRQAFQRFGTVEDIRMPRDHNSGELKGIAYIKFSKASEAALAIQETRGQFLPGGSKPIKVMVAGNRSDIQSSDDEDKYKRIFITIPKSHQEDNVDSYFKTFGTVDSVLIQRDRKSGESKGFAYVKFMTFLDAARAVEGAEKMYRAIFAQPKGFSKHQETTFESSINNIAATSTQMISLLSGMKTNIKGRGFQKVMYMCAPYINPMHIQMLFDIVPGMVDCNYFADTVRNCGKGTVTYSNPMSAAYAVEKLNNFEYPPGVQLFVRPDKSRFEPHEHNFQSIPKTVGSLRNAITAECQSGAPDLAKLAEAIAEASKLVKMATVGANSNSLPDSNDLNYCSIALPPPQPLAHIDSEVAMRCFLVCKPQPPPLTVLRDVFCRFGDLINVYTLPNKTVGYARYASVEAAKKAMETLHGAEICGVRIKVLEAEEEAPNKRMRFNNEDLVAMDRDGQ